VTAGEVDKGSAVAGFDAKYRFKFKNGFSSRFQDKAASA
jgi:hypothetical protein